MSEKIPTEAFPITRNWWEEPYIVPIPSSRKAARIQENGESTNITLSAQEVADIDRALDSTQMSGVYGGAKISDKS